MGAAVTNFQGGRLPYQYMDLLSKSCGSAAQAARIMIVRHAESLANAGGTTSDSASIPITANGQHQAERLANLIMERPSLVVVSRFCRTTQTAVPLLKRYPGVPVECWNIEEFTHLNLDLCAGTTYAQRKVLRDEYWDRCDPQWVDGPGCECFADFVARVRCFRRSLALLNPGEFVVIFTHGLLMQVLLWLELNSIRGITHAEMRRFDDFRRSVSMPNCGRIRAAANGGRIRLSRVPEVH